MNGLDLLIFLLILISLLIGFLFLVKTIIEMPEFFIIIIQLKKEVPKNGTRN